MPGPYVTFTRATSDVPGSVQGEHYWSTHPTGLARTFAWWPSASFQDAPVLAVFGLKVFTNYGDSFSTPQATDFLDNAWLVPLCTALNAAGWAIVAFDRPPGPNTIVLDYEIPSFCYFPEFDAQLATAVAYLKGNASGEGGLTGTKRGAALWGAGNSIDPDRIAVVGLGEDGGQFVNAALMPEGALLPYTRGRHGATVDPYLARFGAKPKALVSLYAAWDWTQFDVTAAGGATVYSQDAHPLFVRGFQPETWTTIDPRLKVAASPYHQLLQGNPSNRSVAIYAGFRGAQTANDVNLGPQDFAPGTRLSDAAGGKAYRSPGHFFQGPAVEAAVLANAAPTSRVRWGTAAQNPETPHFTGAALASDVETWLTTTVEV